MSIFKNKDKPTTNEATTIYKQFESVRTYKHSMGFEKDWKKYIDFVEDRQWAYTELNKNMPKPQHNIIKFTKKAKTSAVLSDTIKMVFAPVETVDSEDIANEAADMLNDATDQTLEEIDQAKLDAEVISDAFTLGTGFSHYFFDNNLVGGYKTKYKGSMSGETIDLMNIFPGNPQQKNKDKQPFWIITYRDLIETIKKIAKDNEVGEVLIEQIVADKDTQQEQYDASKFEVLGEEKATVYVKYWRDITDNKIYFCKATKNVLFEPKTELWDYQGTDVEPYPIAYFNWEDRKKSIFGIGEVEGMVYNQKAINFISAMQILNVQNTGWSKYIVKNDALQQKIQNVPGEVIKDVSGVAGDNIKAMQPAQMSGQGFQVLDNIITNTRIFNGVSESITGESMGANMAASAIMALQNQAKVPLDAVRKKFYRYRKDVGRIMEFFFKCKYNLPRTIKTKNEQGDEATTQFLGTKYKDVPLAMKIDIGTGSNYSESLQMNSIDYMAGKGWINKWEYAKFVPGNAIPKELKDSYSKQYDQMKDLVAQQQSAFLYKDMPNIRINYSDLAQDAKLQVLEQMGIKSQGGLSDEMGIDQAKNQADFQLAQQKHQADIQIKSQPTPDKMMSIQHELHQENNPSLITKAEQAMQKQNGTVQQHEQTIAQLKQQIAQMQQNQGGM